MRISYQYARDEGREVRDEGGEMRDEGGEMRDEGREMRDEGRERKKIPVQVSLLVRVCCIFTKKTTYIIKKLSR